MFKRPHYIAFGFVLVLVVILLNLPAQTAAHLKLAIGGLFLPLFGLAGSAQQLSEKVGDEIVPRAALIAEVKRLQIANQELRIKVLQHEQVLEENSQLRQAVGWQKQTPWRVKVARVIARDPAAWWRTLMIDRGSRDGIQTNFAIVTPEGLIGRVDQVGLTTARVVLLGDPKCQVSAMIEKTRHVGALGVSSGSVLEQNLIELTYLPKDASAEPGQRVVTSGLGGYFPPGIPIGEIVDSRTVGFGMYREARVKLSANLKQLEQVWVKLP